MGILKQWFTVCICFINSKSKATPFNNHAPWTTYTLEGREVVVQGNAELPIHFTFQFIKGIYTL